MPQLTIAGGSDGFGAQYQGMMSGYAFCAQIPGYTYVHTPFHEIAHNVDPATANAFIGIPAGVAAAGPVEKKRFAPHVHSCPRPSIFYTNAVIRQLQTWYYSGPKPVIDETDIAIHIRRGDVSAATHPNRMTADAFYVKLIGVFKKVFAGRRITIFSEGTPADFPELATLGVEFRLNEDALTTFHSLVRAKVLVMAKSSFSYAAAILNENTIYYIPFWHAPLDSWKVLRQ